MTRRRTRHYPAPLPLRLLTEVVSWATSGWPTPAPTREVVERRVPLTAPVRTSADLLPYFDWAHLPPKLQLVSKPCRDLAHEMDILLPNGAEKTAGMRKLLEAKDCFVRAAL